jgi:hypothetical protein
VWCATHCGVTHFRGVVASSWVKWPLLSAHKLSCSSRRGPASLTSDTRRGPHKLVVESHRALPQAQFSPHRGPRTVHFISVCSSVYESNMNNRDQVDPSGKQDSNIFCMVSNGMFAYAEQSLSKDGGAEHFLHSRVHSRGNNQGPVDMDPSGRGATFSFPPRQFVQGIETFDAMSFGGFDPYLQANLHNAASVGRQYAEIPSSAALSYTNVPPRLDWKRMRLEGHDHRAEMGMPEGSMGYFTGDEDYFRRKQREEAEIERMLTGHRSGLGLTDASFGASNLGLGLGLGLMPDHGGVNPAMMPPYGAGNYGGSQRMPYDLNRNAGLLGSNLPGYPRYSHGSGVGALGGAVLSAASAGLSPGSMLSSSSLQQSSSSASAAASKVREMMSGRPTLLPTSAIIAPQYTFEGGSHHSPPAHSQSAHYLPHQHALQPLPRPPGQLTMAGVHCPMYLSRARTGFGNQKETRRRCKVCRTRIAMICKECDVALCFASSVTEFSCWEKYHMVSGSGVTPSSAMISATFGNGNAGLGNPMTTGHMTSLGFGSSGGNGHGLINSARSEGTTGSTSFGLGAISGTGDSIGSQLHTNESVRVSSGASSNSDSTASVDNRPADGANVPRAPSRELGTATAASVAEAEPLSARSDTGSDASSHLSGDQPDFQDK